MHVAPPSRHADLRLARGQRGDWAARRFAAVAAGCTLVGLLGCAAAAPSNEPIAIAPARTAPAAESSGTRLADQSWHAPARSASETASLATLDSALWLASGDSASGHWRLSYYFDGGHYRTSGHPTWDESGRVTVIEADGQRLHLRFTERMYDGKADEPLERWLELARSGNAFTMRGLRFERQPAAATVAIGPVIAGGDPTSSSPPASRPQ